MKYIAYMRKSEEREERQQLSLPAQLKKVNEQFGNLDIVEIDRYVESKSAFKPNHRPLFGEMLHKIEMGEVQGIIAWHPNRLSRNEIDAGRLTYLLRTGVIKDLKFCTYTFENTPEGIWMLQMQLSQSQYDSAKQGRDVKRGMEQKASGGERPGIVPQGYMKTPKLDEHGNVLHTKDKLITETKPDPERFELVERMWHMLLNEQFTTPQIVKIANEQWGYTTKKSGKIGGVPLSKRVLYDVFSNPFYCGLIKHNGAHYAGNHKAMVTKADFDIAQKIIGKFGKPRVGEQYYAYAGLIRCAECNCQMIGKTNTKFNKTEQRYKSYVHYYCTRKSVNRPCTQTKYTSLKVLEEQIDQELSKITILPEFKDLALKILRRSNEIEVTDRGKIYAMQQKRREGIQLQLDSLLGMRMRELIDDSEYVLEKQNLKDIMSDLDTEMRDTELRADDWLELTERAFDFAAYARHHYASGTNEQKRAIFQTLGCNFLLKDQKLTLEQSKWLIPISNDYAAIEREYLRRAGTNKKASSKVKEEALMGITGDWRARRDSNPRHPA